MRTAKAFYIRRGIIFADLRVKTWQEKFYDLAIIAMLAVYVSPWRVTTLRSYRRTVKRLLAKHSTESKN